MADQFAPQPVKTKTNGDVVSAIVDSAGTNKAAVSATGALSVSLTSTASNATAVKVDGTGGTFPISGSLTANQSVNAAQINGVTPLMGNGVTGTGALRVSIASDSTGQVTLATGANTIGALSANQSVNVTQLSGNAIATGSGASNTGTQRVILATDQGTVPVSSGLSFTTGDSGHLTSASLAAGATVTLDGPQIASGTGKLFEASVSSSVALKAQLGTWDGTTFTVKRTFFVPANAPFVYVPTRYDAITMATGATAKFRWSITNNDNSLAADVYASITHAI